MVDFILTAHELQETLHNHDSERPHQDTYKALEAASDTKDGNESAPKENLFKNWPLMSSIISYCVFALHDMAYSEVYLNISLISIILRVADQTQGRSFEETHKRSFISHIHSNPMCRQTFF